MRLQSKGLVRPLLSRLYLSPQSLSTKGGIAVARPVKLASAILVRQCTPFGLASLGPGIQNDSGRQNPPLATAREAVSALSVGLSSSGDSGGIPSRVPSSRPTLRALGVPAPQGSTRGEFRYL